jgi:hypothetical protein
MKTALGRAFYLDFVALRFQSAAIDAREFRAAEGKGPRKQNPICALLFTAPLALQDLTHPADFVDFDIANLLGKRAVRN